MRDEKQPDANLLSEAAAGRMRSANFGNVDFSRVQSISRFYANHAGANITLFDIRLVLNNVEIDADKSKVMADETLTVYMSPELAHVVHTLLGQALATYTNLYGNLRLKPPAQETPTPEPPKPE